MGHLDGSVSWASNSISAQVMISWFVRLNPSLVSVLTVQSLLGILSPLSVAPLLLLARFLSLCLKINLKKETHKTSKDWYKKLKKIYKMERHHVHGSEDIVLRIAILSRFIYMFDIIPVRIPASFFVEIDKLILYFYFYLFLEDRCKQGKGRERGRHRIWSGLQALNCQHRDRRGARTLGPWDHDLSRSPMLNRLSHPGAPKSALLRE